LTSHSKVKTAQVFAIAGPAMVANLTTPLIGIVSTNAAATAATSGAAIVNAIGGARAVTFVELLILRLGIADRVGVEQLA